MASSSSRVMPDGPERLGGLEAMVDLFVAHVLGADTVVLDDVDIDARVVVHLAERLVLRHRDRQPLLALVVLRRPGVSLLLVRLLRAFALAAAGAASGSAAQADVIVHRSAHQLDFAEPAGQDRLERALGGGFDAAEAVRDRANADAVKNGVRLRSGRRSGGGQDRARRQRAGRHGRRTAEQLPAGHHVLFVRSPQICHSCAPQVSDRASPW